MDRQTAGFLKWAGILLIFANVMAWEGEVPVHMAVSLPDVQKRPYK